MLASFEVSTTRRPIGSNAQADRARIAVEMATTSQKNFKGSNEPLISDAAKAVGCPETAIKAAKHPLYA
jgi:hypothetical protein